MELVREYWDEKNIREFEKYLESFGKGEEKSAWEQRIINTKVRCIAVPSPEVGVIVKGISKGNFIEFLNFWLWNNHTEVIINGQLICKIKDFNLMKEYLIKYAERVDDWAAIDSLKFNITDKNRFDYFNFAKKIIISNKPFVRRLALIILLKLSNYEEFVDEGLMLINSLYNETEYYVNMANAWLLAEYFVKYRDKTFKFIKSAHLNKFTINKAISKCHDSFRVSEEDKILLKSFRIK